MRVNCPPVTVLPDWCSADKDYAEPPERRCTVPTLVSIADPLAGTGDSTSFEATWRQGHRYAFGLWDGSRLPAFTEPVQSDLQRNRVTPVAQKNQLDGGSFTRRR